MSKAKRKPPWASLVELLEMAQEEAKAEAAVRPSGALQMVRRKLDSAQRHLDTHRQAIKPVGHAEPGTEPEPAEQVDTRTDSHEPAAEPAAAASTETKAVAGD